MLTPVHIDVAALVALRRPPTAWPRMGRRCRPAITTCPWAPGLKTDGSALAFPSAFGLWESADRNGYHTLGNGLAEWNKYVVVYLAAGSLCWREVGVPAGSPLRASTSRLSQADLGSGPHPLSFYLTGGRALPVPLRSLACQLVSGSEVHVGVEVELGGSGWMLDVWTTPVN